MNKKIVFFSTVVAFSFVTPNYAANNNPASVSYVQSQIETLVNYVNSKISSSPLTPTYTVGQHALGGIVFYVDSSGSHGLVAANNQFANSQTWNGGLSPDVIVNAIGNGIGAGAMNTSLSVGVQSAKATATLTDMAAQYCVNFSIQADGVTPCADPGSAGESCYADFYLPSLYELHQMFLQNAILNVYPNSQDAAFFWSSTEDGVANAFRVNFSVPGGIGDSAGKDSQCAAWCIRSF